MKLKHKIALFAVYFTLVHTKSKQKIRADKLAKDIGEMF